MSFLPVFTVEIYTVIGGPNNRLTGNGKNRVGNTTLYIAAAVAAVANAHNLALDPTMYIMLHTASIMASSTFTIEHHFAVVCAIQFPSNVAQKLLVLQCGTMQRGA
jgi:hypothetical protein